MNKLNRFLCFFLLILLFPTVSFAQYNFRSENTIFKSPKDRAFMELWGSHAGPWDPIRYLSEIRVTPDSKIVVLGSSGFVVLDKTGKLLASSYWHGSTSGEDLDNKGNILQFSRTSETGKTTNSVFIYTTQGKVDRRVVLRGGGYGSQFFTDNDRGFYLTTGDTYYRDWEDRGTYYLSDVFHFSSTGKLLSRKSMEDFFIPGQRNTTEIFLGKDKHLYGLDTVENLLHRFDSEGEHLAAFDISPDLKAPIVSDTKGNLVLRSKDENTLTFVSTSGPGIRTIAIRGQDGKALNIGEYAFDHDGSVIVYNWRKDLITRHDKDGNYLATILDQKNPPDSASKIATDFKYLYGENMVYGNDGNIYFITNKLAKYDSRGRLLNVIEKNFSGMRCVRVDKQGYIFASTNTHLKKFSPEGELLAEVKYEGPIESRWQGVNSFVIAPDDHIYALKDTDILHYSPELRLLEIYKRHFLYNKKGLSNARWMELHDNQLVIRDGQYIKKFTMEGKYLSRFKIDGWRDRFNIDKDGNIYVYYRAYTWDGKLLQNSNGIKLWNFQSLAADKSGRLFFGNSDWANSGHVYNASIEPLKSKKTKTFSIKGTVDLKGLRIWYNRSRTVFLEGKTPDGTKFHSFVEFNHGKFGFNGIPDGSSYKVWAVHPHYYQHTYIKSLFKGKITGHDAEVKFISQPISRKMQLVRGAVYNQHGVPLLGVKISHGKRSVYTDLEGRFCLPVPPNSTVEIKASKAGYQFRQPFRTLKIKDMDRFFIYFKAR